MSGQVSGLISGLISGVQSGLNPLVGGYSISTLTPAEIATITGQAEPTLMWLGSDASGADELVVGTDDLSDVGAPSKQVLDTALNGLTTQMLDSVDSMDAAGNTVADIAVETVTVIQILRPSSYTAGAQTLGKRDGNGYELKTTSSGRFQWACRTTTSLITETIAIDHGTTNAQVLCTTRQSAVDRQAIWSREGSSVASRNNESLSNAATFAIGSERVGGNLGFYGPVMMWIGTDGDFGDAADFEAARSAIAVALGYE